MPNYSWILIALWLVLVAIKPIRKVSLALAPWLLFACSYDWMRWYPSYMANPIHLEDLYNADRDLFGVFLEGTKVTLCEWFSVNNCKSADLLAGFFYLCWVPVPLGYALWLYAKGRREACLRMGLGFLWVNLFGFALYYIYPAAPPWYVMQYGFEPILNTPGSVAGLERFDSLMPFPIFANIYSGNSNVFAAMPSLHSAYVLCAVVYAFKNKEHWAVTTSFALITIGIWFTAVYSAHHYVLDVLAGIAECLIALALLDLVLLNIPPIKKAFNKYCKLLNTN